MRTAGLPPPRGPLSEFLVDTLRSAPRAVALPPTCAGEPTRDDDFQLALYLSFEVGYRGFVDVSRDWADEPTLIGLRHSLSDRFLDALLGQVGPSPDGPDVPSRLETLIATDDSPSVADYLLHQGTQQEMLEFIVHRSAYLLKEADPHVRILAWLTGRPKAALLGILADEFGGGSVERMHSELYARSLRALGLDSRENAHLSCLPGVTLATANLTSALCDRPRWRGALLGHLAVTEMTSTEANRRYGGALRRLGMGSTEVTEYFDEHVEADAIHDRVAAHEMAGVFARTEPSLAESVVLGGHMLLHVESTFAQYLLASWGDGQSSLRPADGSGAQRGALPSS